MNCEAHRYGDARQREAKPQLFHGIAFRALWRATAVLGVGGAFLMCSAQSAKPGTSSFIDPAPLSLGALLTPPPVSGSPAERAELSVIHQLQANRTPAEVGAAQADDADETIFAFHTVLGDKFSAEHFPVTAALSAHVHAEEPLASGALKTLYARPRPYQVDATVHPVCKTTASHNSYPSGHTLSAYLLAFTLAEALPEKRDAIFLRADDYAHNRLICGVHYPSDLEASRRIALVVFGAMMTDPHFRDDLAAARTEMRQKLELAK